MTFKPFTRLEFHKKNPYYFALLIMLTWAVFAYIEGFELAGSIVVFVVLAVSIIAELHYRSKKKVVEYQRKHSGGLQL